MATNLLFKNMTGTNYGVLQCPKCKKVIFLKTVPKRQEKVYVCCEDGEPLIWLDVETQRIEIEL